jgi:DNA-binding NarL/FixJ family response regulator
MSDSTRHIRVLIADDHAVVRVGMRSLLERQPDLVVVGEASSAAELLARARELTADVVVADLRMPPGDVPTVIQTLVAGEPPIPVVVFTAFDEPAEAARALRAGAMGYVLKQSEGGDLVTAVRRAHAGRRYVDEPLAARVLEEVGMDGSDVAQRSARLSEKEGRVLELVARGYTGPQIAVELGVRVGTVESYRHRIRRKLGLKSRAEVMDFARRTGFSRGRKGS